MSMRLNVPCDLPDGMYPSMPSSPVNPSRSSRQTLDDKFERFHKRNPHIFDQIVSLARQRIARGRLRLSMKLLFEILRETDDVVTGERPYKLSNSFTSFYARLMPPDVSALLDMRTPRRRTQTLGSSGEPLMDGTARWSMNTLFE